MDVIELNSVIGCPNKSIQDVPFQSVDVEISYSDFFNRYLVNNIPCLVKNISKDWKCQRDWVKMDKPHIEYLRNRYGEKCAPVANCSQRYYNSHCTENMSVRNFMDYWKGYILGSYPIDKFCLYLKDWHFTKEFPNEDVYRVPKLFASDWLNEYFLANKGMNDDYKFVYMGPKGSWTPLHSDVFSSFSWSVNLCGQKKWVFYPPGQEDCLKDRYGTLAYDTLSRDLDDPTRYPKYSKLAGTRTLVQGAGDAVFVPSGWHHQVWNLADTISVNHNWVNGCNVGAMWSSLINQLGQVQQEIANCRDMDDWDGHCQLMLKSCFGIDLSGFCDFLIFIANRRLQGLGEGMPIEEPGGWVMGRNHMAFDLAKIKPVFKEFLQLKLSCMEMHMERISDMLRSIDACISESKLNYL
ncbi:hypothetical protein AAG570_002068 [Ranatra chinensis]|uniref:2-oxoglutarate and iron-dependent oxygenase JMJD4 n=1 Tax=Ranatra chinensis TaxID=642074 RepID=A0ABD0YAB9_9HEMI